MVTVRFFAAARAAAGVAEMTSPATTLGRLRTELAERGEQLSRVVGVASFLVDGIACRDLEAPLPASATVDVLPPFAGG